eukprot:16094641-Heterocapsa_arctica.AAC.1
MNDYLLPLSDETEGLRVLRDSLELLGDTMGRQLVAGPEIVMLFLGPFAMESIVDRLAHDWARRLGRELDVSFKCVIAPPPFD